MSIQVLQTYDHLHAINNFYNSKVNTIFILFYFTMTQPSQPFTFYVITGGETQQTDKTSSTIPVVEFTSFVESSLDACCIFQNTS
jgi:hypothetical protein